MTPDSLFLRDANDIESFYAETTGMMPGFMQLSAGAVDLQVDTYELGGVSLVWARSSGHTRWCDEQADGTMQFGFLVDGEGIFTTAGREVSDEEAMLWIPGEAMEYVMRGPLLTLEIGIAADIVEELGWHCSGRPLRAVPRHALRALEQICRLAAENACPDMPSSEVYWRDNVLEALERCITPWTSNQASDHVRLSRGGRYSEILLSADEFFERMGYGEPFSAEDLSESIGVPKRTVFQAYRKLLGIGPRRYFELKRLHALHLRLKQARPGDMSITTVATELGFGDLGRMAARYREQFGESPSDTLRT